mgnify:CR=1 FL=1
MNYYIGAVALKLMAWPEMKKIIYLPACLLLVPTFGCGKNSHAKGQQNDSLPHYNSLKIYHNINENGKIINRMWLAMVSLTLFCLFVLYLEHEWPS